MAIEIVSNYGAHYEIKVSPTVITALKYGREAIIILVDQYYQVIKMDGIDFENDVESEIVIAYKAYLKELAEIEKVLMGFKEYREER